MQIDIDWEDAIHEAIVAPFPLGIGFDDLECFYLAGGFANYLDVDAARQIGMIPDLPPDQFKQIGNAAIEGATIALRSKTQRSELESVLQQIEHIELETDKDFFDYFVDGCQFVKLPAS